MKNRRGWASTLFSPVSMRALHYANYTAVGLVLFFAFLTAALLWELEIILAGAGVGDPGGEFVLTALARLKYLIPLTLLGVAVFLLIGELARSRQTKGEMTALLFQINTLREGRYAIKRSMRKTDQLQPLMNALHELADQLERARKPDVA